MRYKTIGRCVTFNPNQFIYDKIELKDEFPQSRTDEECYQEITDRIMAMAKMSYPWLFEEKEFQVVKNGSVKLDEGIKVELVDRNRPLPIQEVEKPKDPASILEVDIRNCKTIGELRTWKMLVDKNPVLKEAYDEVYNQLTKTESVQP